METITIPSPSVFLSSPVIKPAPEPPPIPKRKTNAPKKPAEKSVSSGTKESGEVKPKQSKSRNGCITCKAKRLKCDETKPTCQQCHKRSVVCGGYKKDFKWRPFEETAVAQKAVPSKPKKIPPPKPVDLPAPAASPRSDGSASTPNTEPDGDASVPQESFFDAAAPSPPIFTPPGQGLSDAHIQHGYQPDMNTSPFSRELPRPRFEPDSITRSLSSLFDDVDPPPISSPRQNLSGQSPRLIDLLLPGSDLNARPESLPSMGLSTTSGQMSPMMDQDFLTLGDVPQGPLLEDDDVEEIIRQPTFSDAEMWMNLQTPPMASPTSSSFNLHDNLYSKMYRQPEVLAGSPEMLMLRFDKQTCGILSVKDGPTENPWRTLIWPLARDSPALYHAIASMTAFHTSKEKPALRVDGMEHMRSSIRSLASGIEKMRTDTALATTLVLAFSESWDQHISTGIEHLRGAKILVNQALVSHRKRALSGDDLARLKFLCNTWVYMDVIARLTSIDDDESNPLDQVVDSFNSISIFNDDHAELDPLMGCAATLFPLIGRAANLCRRVRNIRTNSIQIISQAMELKEAIEQWHPAPVSAFERPEDPTSEVQHALQTAEAYRYATLLYLHQAVPEIPSPTSAVLAKKVLVYLATVPLSSRLVIVQIYPLLAAGCEAYENEDRQWVEERWHSMANRMWIGNIDRCWEVMQEVWSRRDAHEVAKAAAENRKQRPGAGAGIIHSETSKRKFEEELALDDEFSFSDMLNGISNASNGRDKRQRSSMSGSFVSTEPLRRRTESAAENADSDFSVRGKLHWVGVMKDWEWEILLG